MKLIITRMTICIAAAIGLATSTASAVNSFYAPGDLVLFFQKLNGDTVYANLGAATTFRGTAAGAAGGVNQINFMDINATLKSAFGDNWASDTTIYAGLAGVFNTSNTTNSLNNGDPARTLYVSKSRDAGGAVGTANSTAWTGFTNGAMTDAASKINTQNNIFLNNYDAAQTVSLASVSMIDDQNPLITVSGNTFQGPAFSNFAGGVSQQGTAGDLGTFGSAGTAEFNLDLYRMLARATGGTGTGQTLVSGQVDGPLRTGSYEGTITVSSVGKVSFVAQGAAPTSAYDTWIATFPSITLAADKLPSADPENDALSNLMEFVLNGNPSVSSQTILPTLNTSSSDFVFSFTRRADSTSEVAQTFEYSVNLSDWTSNTPVTIPTTPGTSGFATVGATTGTAPNQVQAVTVSIPKGANTKIFGRLRVIK